MRQVLVQALEIIVHTQAGFAMTASRAKVTNSSVTPQLLDAPSLDLPEKASEQSSRMKIMHE